MWSPIPRTPTSCALSTWWLPNLSRLTAPVPKGTGALLFRTSPPPAAYTVLRRATALRQFGMGVLYHVLLSLSEPLLPPGLLLRQRERRSRHPARSGPADAGQQRRRRCRPLAGLRLRPRLPVGKRGGEFRLLQLLRLLPGLTKCRPAGRLLTPISTPAGCPRRFFYFGIH